MESMSFASILKLLGEFGTVGLVIFLWWYDNKRIWAVMERYERDMVEQRKMYENNVALTRQVANIAEDLRDIVIMNTQQMTHVEDAIKQNQFCPIVRVDRQKVMQLYSIMKESENKS